MREWTPAARRLGLVSAWGMVAIGILYCATGAGGVLLAKRAAGGDHFGLDDPYLAILEAFIVASAPLMILVATAVHAYASQARRIHAIAALALTSIAAAVTAAIHFVRLVVERRLEPAVASEWTPMLSFHWPSVAFALDLLVWDLFLGLALLATARVFAGDGAESAARRTSTLAGVLCVVGFLGPVTGDLRLQVIAIPGYALIYPAACLCMAIAFARRTPIREPETGRET